MTNKLAQLFTFAFFSLTIFFANGGLALAIDQRSSEIKNFLDHFDQDPAKVMNLRRRHYDRRGAPIPANATLFSRTAVETRRFITEKYKLRSQLFGLEEPSGNSDEAILSGYEPNDDPRKLVDRFELTDPRDIEAAGLRASQAAQTPWSDDYWPIYRGQIARRYATEDDFPNVNWKMNYDHFVEVLENYSSVETLSPAEKYDLLVGDGNKTLSHAMWETGKKYYDLYGKVETWMGLCHGWAAASYMMPRPANAIEVLAADGKTKIRFYPSDIKALATLLWSNAPAPKRFIGGRCDNKEPRTNENGRVLDPECFDANPGTWHLAVVNQLGLSKRPLVMDATFDYQVWNQPVFRYDFTYFNPQTNTPVKTLKEARVKMRDFSKDKFKAFRSDRADSVIGIAMDIAYTAENMPLQRDTDEPNFDNVRSVRYLYDLEIDRDGHIIGGEWYENIHPDFLWTPTPKARAWSFGDSYLDARGSNESWAGSSPVPMDWQKIAPKTSAVSQPLARIVESLILISKVGPNN